MNNFNSEHYYDASFSPDEAAERRRDRRHPTPEQALFRMAVERALMTRQRKIWEYWNYDRLTQDEIAKKMRTSQSNIAHQIKRIEGLLTKWCRDHMAVYRALVEAQNGKRGDK